MSTNRQLFNVFLILSAIVLLVTRHYYIFGWQQLLKKKYWKVESPFKKCSALLDLLEKNWNRILWVQKEVIIFSYLLCLAPTWFRKYLVLPIRRCQSRITNIGFKWSAVWRLIFFLLYLLLLFSHIVVKIITSNNYFI